MSLRSSTRGAAALALLVAGLIVTACGAAPKPAATPAASAPAATTTAAPTATPTPAGPAIALSDVWARATPGLPDENSAVYAVIQNRQDKVDRVVSASVPESVAKRVELHTTVREGDTMKMQQVPGFDLPRSGSFKLEPGGFHIMLLGLGKQLKPGDTFTISLKLASGASVESRVEVRTPPATGTSMPGAMPSGTGAAGGMGR